MLQAAVRISAIAVIRGIINLTRVVVILAFRITYYYFWKYGQHNNFHRKMSSEQVTNIDFCSGSDIAVNRTD